MPLKFTDAIEEVHESSVAQEDLLKYLREHAPQLANVVEREMLSKNFAAGDVHVTSAGGDDKKKKKKPEPPISVGYVGDDADARKFDPDEQMFGSPNSGGSSNEAFDWWVTEVQRAGGDAEKLSDLAKLKLKHKTSLEAEPNELKALADALKDNPTLRAALQQALTVAVTGDVGKATVRTITVVRHGATHLNNQDTSVDRIRGWTDVPLSEEGRKEAQKTADKMAKECPDHIVTSDLDRAHQTAKMIAKACNMKVDQVTQGFRPWNVGDYAGKTSKEAVPILVKYAVEKPDEKVPGGESFNTFRSRFFKALSEAITKYSGRLALVTHHRGERLLTAWQAAGFPADGTIDGKEFSKKGEGTAGFEDLEIPVDALHSAAAATVTKWVNPPEDFSKIFQTTELGDKTMTLSIAKIDAEQQIFYGWAYVSEQNGQIIVDKQDDFILPAELLAAAEDFTLQGGKLGDMHDKRNVGRVVASFVTTDELCKTFGISVADDKRGWILGFKVDDPEVWKKIKGGAQLELSIGGRGERVSTVING